jgi:ribosomal protein S18 acetylase RimI-like enzyme
VNSRKQSYLFQIMPLGSHHNRAAFSCGVESLDRYLQKQAGQDVAKHVAAVFVATPNGQTIAGFYTLSAHAISAGELPLGIARKLPRYPSVPVTLLGRLAVNKEFQSQGLGEILLLDALKRAMASTLEVASAALVVDAQDENARNFYLRYDFIPFLAQPSRLFYLMKSVEKLFHAMEGQQGE